MTPEECAEAKTHLSAEERQAFKEVLDKYTDVFDGKLGFYPHEKVNIRLEPGAKPVHKRPYPVPYKREELFKRELKHLIREGVLPECGATDWALPTFIVPKKDDRVRWVSDLRALNELIERPQYPLPRIHGIMLK